jgi:hypothetical protein
MQGAQTLRNEAYILVRRSDEGCSATQKLDFLRSRLISIISTVPLMRVKGIDASPSKNIFTLSGLYTIKNKK